MLTVVAPAKLNLTLEVLGERPDGYHEIRSVIQTISLCDGIRLRPDQKITFKSNLPEWTPKKSLAVKAVRLIQEATQCLKGVAIEIVKRIPLISGLGGDSSDAAAVLLGLNIFWNLGLSLDKLLELATNLGSDVAFFLYNGAALVKGRGEIVTPLPPLPHQWVLLVVPDMPRLPGKTKQLYTSLKTSHYTDGQITERLATELRESREFTPSLLFNTFENLAFTRFSKLETYRKHLLKLGAPNIHLAGSGPTLFIMVENMAQAQNLYTLCKNQGMEAYLAETLAGREQPGARPLFMS